MKKYLYFTIIFSIISLIPILKVNASENCNYKNFTDSVVDSSGNKLPELCINENITTTNEYYTTSSYVTVGYNVGNENNKEYFIFEVLEDSNYFKDYKYVVYILADYSQHYKSSSSRYYFSNFTIDKSNGKFWTPNYSGISASRMPMSWTYSTSSLAAAQSSTTYLDYSCVSSGTCSGFSLAYYPWIVYAYNESTSSWNLMSSTQIYNGSSTTWNNILYSTFDLYYGSDEESLELIYKNNSTPDYLKGYKEIVLTTETKYILTSSIKKGSVYIPLEDFNKYNGRLSYFDKELSSQPYSSVIQDYTKMSDNLFIRQDFDIDSYEGADYVLFNKYLYLEGEDNVSYSIWVPDESYNSEVTITPNIKGGNDFTYTYIDENGEEQTATFSSSGNANLNTIINYVFSNTDNSILSYFSSIWEMLKQSSIYNYLILVFSGSLIIYFIKAMNK